MKKSSLVAVGMVAVLSTGCMSVPAQQASEAPAGSNRPTAGSSVSALGAPTPNTPEPNVPAEGAPASKNDGTAPFGEAYVWDDGLSLTVGKPAEFKPGKWAYTGGQEYFVAFDVRIVNNTGAPWDPGLFHATIQSANTEGERVFDSENLPPEPSTKLLDGREVTFRIAFGVADPSDLVLEVFGRDSVLFHG